MGCGSSTAVVSQDTSTAPSSNEKISERIHTCSDDGSEGSPESAADVKQVLNSPHETNENKDGYDEEGPNQAEVKVLPTEQFEPETPTMNEKPSKTLETFWKTVLRIRSLSRSRGSSKKSIPTGPEYFALEEKEHDHEHQHEHHMFECTASSEDDYSMSRSGAVAGNDDNHSRRRRSSLSPFKRGSCSKLPDHSLQKVSSTNAQVGMLVALDLNTATQQRLARFPGDTGPGVLIEDHFGDGLCWRVRWVINNSWGIYSTVRHRPAFQTLKHAMFIISRKRVASWSVLRDLLLSDGSPIVCLDLAMLLKAIKLSTWRPDADEQWVQGLNEQFDLFCGTQQASLQWDDQVFNAQGRMPSLFFFAASPSDRETRAGLLRFSSPRSRILNGEELF